MIKKVFRILLLTLCLPYSVFAQTTEPEILLDHIVLGVVDLDNAKDTFFNLGFTIKDGRLHSNGLLNKHIKFKDGSSLELMTVIGEPKDEMAEAYQEYLEEGEGGIYIALRTPFDIVMEKADKLGLSYQVNLGDPFSYLTFENEGLKSLFFIGYEELFIDSDSITTHQNKAHGIKSIWLTSSPLFTELITSLGAEFKGTLKTPDENEYPVYRINGYDLIIDDSLSEDSGIKGVFFDTNNISSPEWVPPSLAHGIWIGFQ